MMGSRLLDETDHTPSPVIERLEARIAELEAENAAIESRAEDRTEYVLAQINAGLRVEITRLRTELEVAKGLLAESAADIEAEAQANYPEDNRSWPSIRANYDAAMDLPRRIRQALTHKEPTNG
jgi:hypothetical protein